MAPPLFGVLFRVVLGVGSIALGAFKAAYNQAAARGAGAAGASQAAGGLGAKLQMTKTQPMTTLEAIKILGLKQPGEGESLDFRAINERFEKMFKNNDPKKGGSFYIQSKVIRAKQLLEYELIKENKLTEEERYKYESTLHQLIKDHTLSEQKASMEGQ
ncbi:hypothetical protein ABK040_002863 [Willaertia magna]